MIVSLTQTGVHEQYITWAGIHYYKIIWGPVGLENALLVVINDSKFVLSILKKNFPQWLRTSKLYFCWPDLCFYCQTNYDSRYLNTVQIPSFCFNKGCNEPNCLICILSSLPINSFIILLCLGKKLMTADLRLKWSGFISCNDVSMVCQISMLCHIKNIWATAWKTSEIPTWFCYLI